MTAEEWAFCSEPWAECNFECVNLTKVHRQKDLRFVKILEKIRFGQPFIAGDIVYIRSGGANDDFASDTIVKK